MQSGSERPASACAGQSTSDFACGTNSAFGTRRGQQQVTSSGVDQSDAAAQSGSMPSTFLPVTQSGLASFSDTGGI